MPELRYAGHGSHALRVEVGRGKGRLGEKKDWKVLAGLHGSDERYISVRNRCFGYTVFHLPNSQYVSRSSRYEKSMNVVHAVSKAEDPVRKERKGEGWKIQSIS